MTPELIALVVGVGLPLVLGLVWLVRLEGRVNTHDDALTTLRDDVHYIRARIDTALGVKPE